MSPQQAAQVSAVGGVYIVQNLLVALVESSGKLFIGSLRHVTSVSVFDASPRHAATSVFANWSEALPTFGCQDPASGALPMPRRIYRQRLRRVSKGRSEAVEKEPRHDQSANRERRTRNCR